MSDAATQAAAFRANLAFTQRLLEEAQEEYTSKARLRMIALSALATLEAGYAAMAEAAEAEAAGSSGLLITPSEGLVVP